MTRSANILGFAFLALAVTMTAMITMRNSPQMARDGATPQADQPRGRTPGKRAATPSASPAALASERAALERGPQITFAPEWLASLPADERQTWLARAAAVERQAREQLDRLTGQLDLSHAQRAKLFPALARSAAGYDPAMLIGGGSGFGRGDLTPSEEIHALLNEDQQETVEDGEVSRQLWWQAVLDRLEADLTNETGGGAAGPGGESTVPQPVAPDGEREAPDDRDDTNLFDLLNR
jgi:hypothetical protein